MRYAGAWVLAACSIAFFPSAPASADDTTELQGVWTVVSAERDGKPMDPARIAGRQLEVRGNTFRDSSPSKSEVYATGTFTVHADKTPRWIDASFESGELKGKSCKAIYQVEGETLRTCTAVEGDPERPSAFKSQPATGQMVFVYRRAR